MAPAGFRVSATWRNVDGQNEPFTLVANIEGEGVITTREQAIWHVATQIGARSGDAIPDRVVCTELTAKDIERINDEGGDTEFDPEEVL